MRTNHLTCLLVVLLLSASINAANILYFNQDCNFDLAGGDNTCADERYNLLNIVKAKGHSVTRLPDFHVADLAGMLEAHEFLLIPDLEDAFVDCGISDPTFISDAEKGILKVYVKAGGSL